jgi:NADPH:quinone reductase-like Zn-dependent oxidoreductase
LPSIAKILKGLAYEDAAASCLFIDKTIGLDLPSIDGIQHSQGKTLLVWGASSNVGPCGVQMAVLAGYEVMGVASKRNHEIVRGLGASACFDRKDPALVDDIVTYLRGKDVVGAYSAIDSNSALDAMCEILDRSDGRKLVASAMPGTEEKANEGSEGSEEFRKT